jgi:dTDP-4-amino-4,6-dideoxygalactose transaminase
MVAVGAMAPAQALQPARIPARGFIPALPTLSPRMLVPSRVRTLPTFPFDARRRHAFYFARNAVWHGVRLLGLAGQEVLVPAYHHGVEIQALLHAGCTLRWVRVDGQMRLDLEDLAAKIGPRTRALYVIHYAGFPQPMEPIMALARRHGLKVIEDCALALLSSDGTEPLGARGDLGVFCLYKTLPVPNGGLLVVNGTLPELAQAARPAPLASTLSHAASSLLAHAALRLGEPGQALRAMVQQAERALRRAPALRPVSTGTRWFDPAQVDLGMSALSGLILGRLDHPSIVAARRRNYFLLLSRLRDAAPPIFATLPPGVCPLFYPLLCIDKLRLQRRLAARGVETVDFWSSGHPSCPVEQFPEVELLRRRVLELPIHQDLGPEEMAALARSVEECLP